jgi:hypothetical protein
VGRRNQKFETELLSLTVQFLFQKAITISIRPAGRGQ